MSLSRATAGTSPSIAKSKNVKKNVTKSPSLIHGNHDMTTLPFTSSTIDQVRLNLIHYNLWTQVEVHNNYILSGLPPSKLVSTDPDSKHEWIVCKRLNEHRKLKVREINSWFEEIKEYKKDGSEDGTSGDVDEPDSCTETSMQNSNINDAQQNEVENQLPCISVQKESISEDNHSSTSIWKPIDNTMNGKGRVRRLTIALINDDGTIVYYFIHDGITKPRQH